MLNNFTRPAEGLPVLELSVFYDTDMAQINFDDFVTPIQYGCNALTIGGYECAPETIGDLFELNKMNKRQLLKLAYACESETETEGTKADIIEGLELVKLADCCGDETLDLLDSLPSKYGYMTTCGYSQGDCCAVLYLKDKKPSREWIDKLFWDCPIHACLTIDGEENYLDEYLESSYDYNKETILSKYDGPEYVKKWLSENLPENPNYV